MVEVLELEPLKKKSLKVVFVESEFPIDWWFDASVQEKHDLVWNLHLITNEYLDLVKEIIDKYNPDFAMEEKGSRWADTISKDDPLEKLFRKHDIPYSFADISENAEAYLSSALDEYREVIRELSDEIQRNIELNNRVPTEDFEFQKMVTWKQHLENEYKAEENDVRYKVREAWMMMRLLEKARKTEKKKITSLFICDKRHFDGLSELAEELGVDTQQIKIKRSTQVANNPGSYDLKKTLNKSVLELSPIKVKKKEKADRICYFFDTDENASPFDINMAYDAGFDVVVPVNDMTADKVSQLVQDAIFSRKPGAPTTFFIGGSNVKEGEKIAKKVQESLVPPFECPVIIDPRGSHTTASSVIAKTMEIAMKHGIDNLKGKKVAVLGAGPVARIAAILAAKMNCKTSLVETWDKFSEEAVKELAAELTEEAGEDATPIEGMFAPEEDQRYEAVKDVDIVWSLAAAGVEVLSKEVMEKLEGKKLVVDINLVPPYGIKGLKPKDNDKEIYPGIFGIGALALGQLKSKTEGDILKKAANTKGKHVYDYDFAFKVAKKRLFGEKIEITHK
ncbi:MAG: methylene-tetrahydromethanopterin dehydrogenase N-terminal domain-containing protein [Promethearchaeia archaeon]